MDDSAENIDYSASGSIEEQERAADCPTCGAEAEGRLTCPRCGARTQKSIHLDMLFKISGVGIVLGLILLSAATVITAPAKLEIDTIAKIHKNNISSKLAPEGGGPRQVNTAFSEALKSIRNKVLYTGQISTRPPENGRNQFKITVSPAQVTGRVSEVNIEKGSDNFTIELSGGESDLRVRGFGEYSNFKEQLGDRFPPEQFSRVLFVGQLSFDSRYGPSLSVSVPNRFQILEEFEREKRSLVSLTRDDIGNYYVVQGTVVSVDRPGKIRVIELKDRGVYLDLAVPDFQFEELPPRLQNYLTSSGQRIEFLAKISQYRGEMQLSLANPDDPETIGPQGGQ